MGGQPIALEQSMVGHATLLGPAYEPPRWPHNRHGLSGLLAVILCPLFLFRYLAANHWHSHGVPNEFGKADRSYGSSFFACNASRAARDDHDSTHSSQQRGEFIDTAHDMIVYYSCYRFGGTELCLGNFGRAGPGEQKVILSVREFLHIRGDCVASNWKTADYCRW